jgi:SAM-dependent methyltransferase
VGRSFEALVAEAEAAPMDGWDFSWLDGRATEDRPSWGYAGLLRSRLGAGSSWSSVLDVQTGGGEVLAGALAGAAGAGAGSSGRIVATEGWAPNVVVAGRRLAALGVGVVASAATAPLPFASSAFDLVVSRHPEVVAWPELARVLVEGGTYLAQHVGGGANVELTEFFLGPSRGGAVGVRDHEREAAAAEAAGFEVVVCRNERLALTFADVGAVVWFLRKVVWTVPGFTVARHLDRLRSMHAHIEREGPFVSSTSRTLFELRKAGP